MSSKPTEDAMYEVVYSKFEDLQAGFIWRKGTLIVKQITGKGKGDTYELSFYGAGVGTPSVILPYERYKIGHRFDLNQLLRLTETKMEASLDMVAFTLGSKEWDEFTGLLDEKQLESYAITKEYFSAFEVDESREWMINTLMDKLGLAVPKLKVGATVTATHAYFEKKTSAHDIVQSIVSRMIYSLPFEEYLYTYISPNVVHAFSYGYSPFTRQYVQKGGQEIITKTEEIIKNKVHVKPSKRITFEEFLLIGKQIADAYGYRPIKNKNGSIEYYDIYEVIRLEEEEVSPPSRRNVAQAQRGGIGIPR